MLRVSGREGRRVQADAPSIRTEIEDMGVILCESWGELSSETSVRGRKALLVI